MTSSFEVPSYEAPSLDATTVITPVPAPDASPAPSRIREPRRSPETGRAAHRRVARPAVRGNTVVSATAAFGAIATGGFMAVNPQLPTDLSNEAAEALHPAAGLAAATRPLRVAPASSGHALSQAETVTAGVAMLPVAVPGDRSASVDKADVEALHKGERLAAEAAAAHAAAVKEATVLAGGGDLDDWISVALYKLNLDQSLAKGVKKIIMAESRGNPKAINRTDSNALAGRPSQGLMQTIPSTFRAYVLPELAHLPITNPVANITAGVRYMIANYGISTLRNGGRTNSSGNYIGY